MSFVNAAICRTEGHRAGGPLRLGLLLLLAAGCAGGGGPKRPTPERDGGVARPLDVYRELGMLTGTTDYPAVASFATMAGPGDSTYVLFGLSLPNSALRFQREESGFLGEYAVRITFLRDSVPVREVRRREVVRIPSFAETGRTEESVVFQELIPVEPGEYTVEVEARDPHSSRGFRAVDTLRVPRYGVATRRLSEPVVVYRATGRESPEVYPELITNPRRTVAYGGDAPLLYIEGYGVSEGYPVSVRVVDEHGTEVWSSQVGLHGGGSEVRSTVVEIPREPLPLGRLWVELRTPPDTQAIRSPLIVTISDQWMVANFEEVLEFLRYIASSEELDSLSEVTGVERRERWERFWERRDPVPATPINEFREAFFERVRIATEQFGEPGRPGWRTDRGEVFIVLGRPDLVYEEDGRVGDPMSMRRIIVWIYERGPTGRLELVFEDRSGFGRYELTPASESAFRSAANRLRARWEGG